MSERIYGVATKAWQIVAGCDERMPCAAKCWTKGTVNRLAHAKNAKVREFHSELVREYHDCEEPECERREHGRLCWTGTVRLNEAHLTDPLRWRKPAVIATGYHGDLMRLSTEERDRILGIEALTHRDRKGLTFLHLTKLTDEQVTYFSDPGLRDRIEYEAHEWMDQHEDLDSVTYDWPLPNLYLGFSASNQSEFDARWPHVAKLGLSGWKTWVSLEPLIGPINLRLDEYVGDGAERRHLLSQVVLGSESGKDARPMSEDWVRAIRDQCQAASVPFLYKQNVVNGKKIHMPELDGRVWSQLAWEVVNQ